MKNKDKKKVGAKKEIKRPTHKKPRPKKYVEARIPQLPPVPTAQIPITKDIPDTVKFEIPKNVLGPQTPEERFVELINKAADELKKVADNAKIVQPRHPVPKTVYYKPGGIGAILRLEVGGDMMNHINGVMEELEKSHGWSKTFQSWKEETGIVETVEAVEDPAIKTDVDADWDNPENHPHVNTIVRPVKAEEATAEQDTTVKVKTVKRQKGLLARIFNIILNNKK